MKTRERGCAGYVAGRYRPSLGGPAEVTSEVRGGKPSAAVPTETRPTRVAIYARLGAGLEGMNLDEQILACRQAARDGATAPVDFLTFTDGAPSLAMDVRPGLTALLLAARARAFDILVVVSPDRIARDASGLERIWTELDSRGIVLASAGSGRLQKRDITLRGMCTDAARAARRRGPRAGAPAAPARLGSAVAQSERR